jgi:hypothetical protein
MSYAPRILQLLTLQAFISKHNILTTNQFKCFSCVFLEPEEHATKPSRKWLAIEPRHSTTAFSAERGPSVTPSQRLLGTERPPRHKVPNLGKDLAQVTDLRTYILSTFASQWSSPLSGIAFINQWSSSVIGLHQSVTFASQWLRLHQISGFPQLLAFVS